MKIRFFCFFAFLFSLFSCSAPAPVDPTEPTPQEIAEAKGRENEVTQDPKWGLSQPSSRLQRAADWATDKAAWVRENVAKPMGIGFVLLLIFALGVGGSSAILLFNPGIALGKLEVLVEGVWLLIWSYMLWGVNWPPEVHEASRIVLWTTFVPGVILVLAGLAGKTEGGWKLAAIYAPAAILALGYVLALVEIASWWLAGGSLLATYLIFRLFSLVLPSRKSSTPADSPAHH